MALKSFITLGPGVHVIKLLLTVKQNKLERLSQTIFLKVVYLLRWFIPLYYLVSLKITSLTNALAYLSPLFSFFTLGQNKLASLTLDIFFQAVTNVIKLFYA
jgi:hypothetical protein